MENEYICVTNTSYFFISNHMLMCFQKFSVWAENKGKMFMFGIDVWIYFFYFNMFFSLRCQINFLKPRFNIEFDLVIFQVLLLHPQPGWAFLECCHSAGQDGWCFFISECHISGRFNVFVWLQSQKEAKRFHYQQTWNRSFLLNPHFKSWCSSSPLLLSTSEEPAGL